MFGTAAASDVVISKALERYIIWLVEQKDEASTFWKSELSDALDVYASEWAEARGYRKPEWYEASNSLDQVKLDEIRKDIDSLASYCNCELPSVKAAKHVAKDAEAAKFNLPKSTDDDEWF